MKPISLTSLVESLPVAWQGNGQLAEVEVNSIKFDSRQVTRGDLFVAFTGGNIDGHEFIGDAIEKGAIGVVGTREITGLAVPYIRVADAREALAYLAAAYYDHPARKMTVIGVTGTDGKTTTSNLIYEILKAAGLKAGLISTVNAVIGDEVIDTGFHVTTPESTDVQRYLAQMVEAGITHVVLETTSHGLAQHRVTACEYDIAVVTNITHEHLDYHGSYEEYRAAKGRLFTGLTGTSLKARGNFRLAVLNRDDISYDYLSSIVTSNQVSYGTNMSGDLIAQNVVNRPNGVEFSVILGEQERFFHCNIPGRFNVSNSLAAIAVGQALDIDMLTIAQGIERLQGVPGRMEVIDIGQPFTAIVDFAHTPNALKVALETVREMTTGRVIAVFGSAGLRDRQKRRMMAEVSVALADVTILTAEDPRTEALDAILAQMADAADSAGGIEGKNYYTIPDRGNAIRFGIKLAQPGDLVIACGKGHEQSMCFMTTEYPWDDRIAMRAALAELLGVPGPEMPLLPTS
jgi:UDP-N-acetylmuramoyl-L-alanyl-D-glutamate--2,6-diaminopimelate ligase